MSKRETMGPSDAFCETLVDETIARGEGENSVCCLCGSIRLFNATPCSTCARADKKRVLSLFLFALFLIVGAIATAYVVTQHYIPPDPRPVVTNTSGSLDRNLDLLRSIDPSLRVQTHILEH